MKKYLLLSLIFIFTTIQFQNVNAQGCVAIRGMSVCSGDLGSTASLSKGEFLTGIGFRYFKSFRHFRGSMEEANRVEEGTEVINHSRFLDLTLNYGISDRWYGNLVVPFVYHTRSSLYEHGGNSLGDRHETSSKGLSDMRLGIGYWLFDPHKSLNFNYSLGLGIKLPTGSYDYMDDFYNQGPNDDQIITSVVDQSIQPGDGGTGITLELQGFHSVSESFMFSANLYYLFNFQETNGVNTRNGRSEFSCADQFAARLGTYFNTNTGLSAYLGGRIEAVPSHDLFGSSAGYRRPGYAISVEPGFNYSFHNYSFNFSLPIALYRNRTQSYEDEQRTLASGMYRHGDAAFADYLINFSVSYRFGKSHDMPELDAVPEWDGIIKDSH